MALSLADELAGFDDEVDVHDGFGGPSLADEFGMNDELGIGNTPSDELDPFSSPSVPQPRQHLAVDDISSTFNEKTGRTLPHRPSIHLLKPRSHDDTGKRSAKSSSSTIHTISSRSSDHDDGLDEAEYSFNTMAETSYQTAPLIPLSPHFGPDEVDDAFDSIQQDMGRFWGLKGAKDPMVELEEISNLHRRFIQSLVHLDDVQPSVPLRASLNRSTPHTSQNMKEPIEARMQRHLERLHAEDKMREEQCRHLAVLSRELAGVRWDHGMEIEIELASGKGLGLGMIDESFEDSVEDIGWCGDPGPVNNTRAMDLGRRRHSENLSETGVDSSYSNSVPKLEIETPEKGDYLDVPSPSYPITPLSPTDSPITHHQPLPRAADEIIKTSQDLIRSLQGLKDGLHTHQSFSTSTSRQIKGLKSSIDSWREREDLEGEARRCIEQYELSKLSQGISGVGEPGAREVMNEICVGFSEFLDLSWRRMKELNEEAKGEAKLLH